MRSSRSLHSRAHNAREVTMRYAIHAVSPCDHGTVTRARFARAEANNLRLSQECNSCCYPTAQSLHSTEHDSEKSKVSSKPRMIDVTSNRSMSTKASTYAAPSAGTSMLGSDYTSRDGGVRVNPVGSSAPNSSAPSSSAQSQYLKAYDSDEEDNIEAEGW